MIPPKIRLSPLQKRIYEYVARHPGCGIHQIVEYAYAESSNGGPDNAYGVLWVLMTRMRPKLAKLGVTIVADARGPGATYRLKPLDQ